MINVDKIIEVMRDETDTQKYLVIFYTGDAKRGKSVAINIETQEKVPAMTFDIVGPVTDPKKDSLRIMNVCEKYGKIAVIHTIQGVQKRFNIFPTFASWYAERPNNRS